MSNDSRNAESALTGIEIAVVGMAGRFPGARNLTEFWHNLKNGVEGISVFSDDELREAGVDEETLRDPSYVRARGIIEDVSLFDASFFDYTPVEAEIMDPQIRVFTECVWEALEHAGYEPDNYKGIIGLYAGASPSFYWEGLTLLSGRSNQLGDYATSLLANRDYMCTRVAYNLNLRGPSYFVQSACSTSLVAIHLACRALLTGECSMALAGGISLTYVPKRGYFYREGLVSSPDGHCRAFDANASGTVFSDGVGVVVLKRLKNALADGDSIHAVIKGSAINNDGRRKVGFSAPSIEGQAEVIRTALRLARVEPESISYVEAHGTGTALGDPVEIEGLKLAFQSSQTYACGIGSVKTNLGHTDTAAGVAGFIKTALALKHRWIPPSLHFKSRNPKIDFEHTPFYVVDKPTEWKNEKFPLRAGVSSFGIGGTNAHVILEEAPEVAPSNSARPHELLLLSAKSKSALDKTAANLAQFLKENTNANIADVAYTLSLGRKALSHRRALVCSNVKDAIDALSGKDPSKLQTNYLKFENRPVIFMFPGQGSQYVNMGRELYQNEPTFRKELETCFGLIEASTGGKLKSLLYTEGLASDSEASSELLQTEHAQPLIFIFEYALASLLMKLGITPHAMIGHSIGEYVAACLSGVFSLQDAIKLVLARARLMQAMASGAMLSVALSEQDLALLLTQDVELAAVNCDALCVISGPTPAINAFADKLQKLGQHYTRLHTSHAFHSKMMEPMLAEFQEALKSVVLQKPQLPYISNLSGTWITVEEATSPTYWVEHLRRTVRFAEGVAELVKIPNAIFLEAGPGQALSTFVRQHHDKKPDHVITTLIKHPKDNISDYAFFLSKLAQLWLWGKSISWAEFYAQQHRRRIPLPTYPFERQRYWIDKEFHAEHFASKPSLTKHPDINDWFYIPSWKRARVPALPDAANERRSFLMFTDEEGIGEELAKRLRQAGHRVAAVKAGQRFVKQDEDVYTLNPENDEDFVALFKDVKAANNIPTTIVHLWTIHDDADEVTLEEIRGAQNLGFYGLINIARSLAECGIQDQIQIKVITNNLQNVTGEEPLRPEHATILGPVKTIPQEYHTLTCDASDISGKMNPTMIQQLFADVMTEASNKVVAYRGSFCWIQTYAPVKLGKSATLKTRLKPQGVYLLMGGLGGIGLVLAEHLAKTIRAKLILIGRSDFPEKEQWQVWLGTHSRHDRISQKILKLQEFETAGSEVLVIKANVADFEQMKAAIALAVSRFGTINGVIHCAGVPDGRAMQLRTREMTEEILAPKVAGTVILYKLLKDIELDFVVLCSSLNAVFSIFGQVGYCAANAFLDSFAQYKSSKNGPFAVAINWDTWEEVGMAANANASAKTNPVFDQALKALHHPHPLFDGYYMNGNEERTYVSKFDARRHWILGEHRVLNGAATFPGTGYLEMLRAAFDENGNQFGLEIRDLLFLMPLTLAENEEREVRTIVKRSEDNRYEATIASVSSLQNEPTVHARAEVLSTKPVSSRKHNLQEIAHRCRLREIDLNLDANKAIGNYGPRWNCCKWIKLGEHEGLAYLESPNACADDFQYFNLHPALMDVCTGFIIMLGLQKGSYLPLSYNCIRIKKHLPPKVFSHIRFSKGSQPHQKLLSFDVTILDEAGFEVVDINGYTFKEVNLDRPAEPAGNHSANTAQAAPAPEIRSGILPSEGVAVFERILSEVLPQVVVSTRDLNSRIEQQMQAHSLLSNSSDSAPSAFQKRLDLSTEYVAPRNEVEQKLAAIWKNFFGFEQIGIYDDFFELGGDSLRVMVIASRIHKELDIKIPLVEFFKKPNIAGLGEFFQRADVSEFSVIAAVEKRKFYSLSAAQRRLYYLERLAGERAIYNITEVYTILGNLDIERLTDVFRRMIKRHESLRTSIAVVDAEPMQIVHDEVDFQIDYREVRKSEVDAIVASFRRPFDISKAPFLRVCVLKLAPQKHILMFDLYHIIADGTSLLILMKEFHSLYNGLELPELKIHYKDFSEWQNALLAGDAIQKQEEFWLKTFSGELPVLAMPTDYPRPAILTYEGDYYEFELSEEVSARIKRMSAECEATLFMSLIALYTVLLAKFTGQEDIIVGTPVTGRHHADLENVIGMFVSALAQRNFPAPNKIFADFLQEVKENTLKAFENQDYQLEMLLNKLDLRKDFSRNPLFDTLFNFRNMFVDRSQQQDSGLKFIPYKFEDRVAKFDIDIYVFDLGAKLTFNCSYRTSLFSSTTIRYLMGEYLRLIDLVSQDPNKPIRSYELFRKTDLHAKKNKVVIQLNPSRQ